jgi:hypothetical protein
MNKLLRVSVESFAHEIQGDLARLIAQNPTGIYFSALADEYGESTARILKACQVLANRQVISVHQAASKAHYILPNNYVVPVPFVELTELQRKLVLYLIKIGRVAKAVQTNYSQLARIMGCSYGGLHTCINRLVALEYLQIEQPSAPGKQNQLILRLTDTLLEKAANHLDS